MITQFLVYTASEAEVLTSTDDIVLWCLRRSDITIEAHAPEKVAERAKVVRSQLRADAAG